MARLWNPLHVSISLSRDAAVLVLQLQEGNQILEEIVKMLFTMLDQLGCRIAEDSAEYGERADEEEKVEEDQ